MQTDLDIARAARLRPIQEIADRAGIPASAIEPFGHFKAKVAMPPVPGQRGALVLVTGINPTPAGEGKTTTTIGLGDALSALGRRTMICLREPSLGPCFGVKGGATGGGRSQVVPMEDINLHFTGDFHAITAANNLLAALLDNHLYWGNALGIDPRRIVWRRCLDMNDRTLRNIVCGLGGPGNGIPREEAFDITVASEVMAILCLAQDFQDLQQRLARIIVARRRDGSRVTAGDLKAEGAMAALLRDAMKPNLVQTIEGTPALVHGGPFANIAHGCNSLAATQLALSLADVVVTEAGFGADLGGEKFCDIKCRVGGLAPAAAVVVGTIRALKMHGGVARAELAREDVPALLAGSANLRRHVENMRKFGVPVVVAINRFTSDTDREIAALGEAAASWGVRAVLCTHWGDGAAGAMELARAVDEHLRAPAGAFAPLYPDRLGLADKIRRVASEIYRARGVVFAPGIERKLDQYAAEGFGDLPVCMAKTQYSFSADPAALGAPEGHELPVRDVRLAAGAGFVVALSGDVMTMPGLPRVPAAEQIGIDADGRISGLF
jgi:formate--tetrahydrofolate ligase